MVDDKNVKTRVFIIVCGFITVICLAWIIVLAYKGIQKSNRDTFVIEVIMPDNYSSEYTEDAHAFVRQQEVDEMDWDNLPAEDEEFLTVTVSESVIEARFSGSSTIKASCRTLSDEQVIMMTEDDAWNLISNGLFLSYPKGSFNDNKDKLYKIQQENTETIKVKLWFWEDPSDDSNFNKITVEKVFAVNSKLSQLFEHVFEDIYNHPSQPVFNIDDGGMGTWCIRGKNHNPNASLSTHALGSCIDINPSTGSFKVNGTWYGNAYGHATMSESIWNELPECHNKYHVLYDGCPIVEIFKSYGFVWGGDWNSTKDCMHLSFIGEGRNCREKGQNNYLERK